MTKYLQKHASKKYSDIWLTPFAFFKKIDNEFHFDIDVATEWDNPLGTPMFYTEKDNSLKKQWNGNVWLNPPYSNIAEWVEKSYQEYKKNSQRRIVLLIPARTDTKYFHKFIAPYAEVRFIKGRMSFSSKGTAPFPSMLVIFGNKPNISIYSQK